MVVRGPARGSNSLQLHSLSALRRLWAYDYEGEGIEVSGKTQSYIRGEAIEFHFCPCVRLRGLLARAASRTKRGAAALPSICVSLNPRWWQRYLSTTSTA